MEIPLNINTVLLGSIIAQGFFAGILLFISKSNTRANRFLGLLLISFVLWITDSFFNISGVFQQNPNYYFLPIYFSFGFGPLIYFYTQTITNSNFKFSKNQLIHFAPVVLQFGLYVFLQTKDYSFRRWFWQEIHRPYTYNLEFILSLVSFLVYLFLSFKLLRKYQQWINNQFSEVSKINLHWLKIVLSILAIISFLWILDIVLLEFWNYYPSQKFSEIAMGISILVLAAGGLFQSNLSRNKRDENHQEKVFHSKEIKIDAELIKRIESEMKVNRPYLDPDLSLSIFANSLSENPRIISQQINHGLNSSFIDFVNKYRVQAVELEIKNGRSKDLTLLGIALNCGFNSKSTFNRVFKKFTGKNPSHY